MINKIKSLSGPLLWISSLQYYLAQALTASYWPQDSGYSWVNNTISALGNTECGVRSGNYVCSPLHNVMNVSLLMLGITMVLGAVLIIKRYSGASFQKLGFFSMAAAGAGTITVAVFPENSVSSLHIIGAGMAFIFGNVGLLILGAILENLSKVMRFFTISLGIIGLGALLLFVAGVYAGLGIGGMERVVAYPQSIWMIMFGLSILVSEENYEKK